MSSEKDFFLPVWHTNTDSQVLLSGVWCHQIYRHLVMIRGRGNFRAIRWCGQHTQTCFLLPLEGYGHKYSGGIFMAVSVRAWAYACACVREREKESSHSTTLLNK